MIIDLKEFASWNQYSPIDKVEDSEFKEGIFYIKVIDLNADIIRRQKIMTENPAWLNEHADKEGYLRQHVVINIYEKFKIEIEDSTAGTTFTVGDQEEDEQENEQI